MTLAHDAAGGAPLAGGSCGGIGDGSTGLVPSINNSEVLFSVPQGIEVEKVQARCTRLRKNLGLGAKMLCQGDSRTAWMLTLTYARCEDWKPSHVAQCIDHLRKWCNRRGFKLRYLWVMETQTRKSGDQVGESAPHYHLVVWLPGGIQLPHLDSQGWWPHGLTNSVKAVAPVRYVMKYASKFDNAGAFPKGARIYGMGGITPDQRLMRRWVNWPSFVQGNASYTCQWRRAVGGGWLDTSTGEIWPSEWGLVCTSRTHTRLLRLRTHSRKINASGPFSWLPFASVL